MSGLGAMGFYCSALIHFIAIGLTVLVLWACDLLLLPASMVEFNAIHASLSDQDIEDLNVDMGEFPSTQVEMAGGANDDRISNPADFVANAQNEINLAERSLAAGIGNGTSGAEGDGNGFAFQMPKDGSAVTKGSFTAWTEPKNPVEGQPYKIIIEIRIPKDVVRYRSSDLSGFVLGTDGWKQKLPIDTRLAPGGTASSRNGKTFVLRRNAYLPVVDRKVQLIVGVLGAERLVRDTITVKSRLLNEQQKIELVFGGPQ